MKEDTPRHPDNNKDFKNIPPKVFLDEKKVQLDPLVQHEKSPKDELKIKKLVEEIKNIPISNLPIDLQNRSADVSLEIEQREEYKAEAKSGYLSNLGIILDSSEEDLAQQFALSIDYIDQVKDRIMPDAYQHALDYISGEIDNLNKKIPANVQTNFTILRDYILEKGLSKKLIEYSKDLFQKRGERETSTRPKDYVKSSLEEGELYGKIGMLFLPEEKISKNSKEVIEIGSRMLRVYDNLRDLKEDYEKGQIGFKPNLEVKLRLRAELVLLTIEAFLIYPKKIQALRLATKYIVRSLFPQRKDF